MVTFYYRATWRLQREMGEFCRRDADGNKQEEYSGFGENSDIVHISDRPAIF